MSGQSVLKREIKYLFIIATVFAWLICCLAILKFYFFWDRENICKPKVEVALKGFIKEIKDNNCGKYKDIFENKNACEEFQKNATEFFSFHVIEWDADAAMGVILFNDSRSFYSVAVSFYRFSLLSCRNIGDFRVLTIR